ncbi:MAG: response regulator transcription factor [Proteobacteria bacterium]|nr:response regulator transcription factor [Pseudomonadota bacterium]
MDTAETTTQGVKILIVDDHPIVLEGLAQLLSREPDLRVEWRVGGIAEAMAVCRAHRPDFAIVDISLTDGSGLELIRQIHAHTPALPILVMSMHDESLYADRVLRAGAQGYLMKHSAPKHITGAIRTIRAGEIYLSEKMKSAMLDRVLAGGDGGIASAISSLSDHELEIFQLIGSGLKKSEIAARLNRSVNTVEAHRSNIKKKLNVGSSAELARVAFLHTHNQN